MRNLFTLYQLPYVMWGRWLRNLSEKNVNKIYISAINENMLFCYIHAHSHKNYIYDRFIYYPTLWGRLWYKMLHRPPSGPMKPGSLLILPHFLFTCSIFLFILSFVLIITKTSHPMAMRKSIHDVVDVQSVGSRHQMGMLHYWIFYIRVTVHAALRNSHIALRIRHAAPSNYW